VAGFLPEAVRGLVCRCGQLAWIAGEAPWGAPPAPVMCMTGIDAGDLEPGQRIVALQPPSGYGMDPGRDYITSRNCNDPPYYAVYRWLRGSGVRTPRARGEAWHVGVVPGKVGWVGYRRKAFPDAISGDLPRFLSVHINDPVRGAGKGTARPR